MHAADGGKDIARRALIHPASCKSEGALRIFRGAPFRCHGVEGGTEGTLRAPSAPPSCRSRRLLHGMPRNIGRTIKQPAPNQRSRTGNEAVFELFLTFLTFMIDKKG